VQERLARVNAGEALLRVHYLRSTSRISGDGGYRPSMVVYTHGQHESVLRSHRWRTAENSAAYLLPHLRAGDVLLDIGCGTGTITAGLAALVAPGRVSAVDASAEALEQARHTLRDRDNVDFAVDDIHHLGYPDDAFDVVHAHQVLQHVADPVAALAEMRRVCRPGGVVAVRDADYAAMTWYPQIEELSQWLELYERIARENGGEPDAGRRLLAWARAAGFSHTTATASTWCYATAEDRAFWGGMWADRMRHSAIGRQAVEAGYLSEAGIGRIADGWLRWAGTDDGWFAVLHGEVIARP
jgi:SAM-dependent methyltransferase